MTVPDLTTFTQTLARSGLLTDGEAAEAARAAPGAADGVAAWLVSRGKLTRYQADALLRGHHKLKLGSYTLRDRLATGRMAGVYLAGGKNGRPVAVKILPPSRAKVPEAFARFQREARLAVKLQHPNVVRTVEAGEDAGVHFIAMEYLDGETLEDVLRRRGRLPADEALRLLYQALQGLQHLHELGVVHRDLKPANLMLVPGHADGRPDTTRNDTVKILDVGLGRALFDEGAGGEVPADITAPGEMLGEPDYMAPEQARDAHAADIRADVYSLGCVLYHMLTGTVPFPASNPVRKIVRHASEPARPVAEVVPDVPPGVQPLLDALMAKDPAYRPATPAQAARAVQDAQAARGPAPAVVPVPVTADQLPYVVIPAPAAVPDPVPDAVDVELVPVSPPPPAPAATPTPGPAPAAAGGAKVGRREQVFLGLGAAAVVGFGGGIYLLYRVIRGLRTPPPPA